MICAVDTNILLDVFLPDPKLGESSLDKLEKAYARGALVICDIVYAELVPQFPDR
jgi:predicted nucleic acid-binding protein